MIPLSRDNSKYEFENKMTPFEYGLFKINDEIIAYPMVSITPMVPKIVFHTEDTKMDNIIKNYITVMSYTNIRKSNLPITISRSGIKDFNKIINSNLIDYGFGLLGYARFAQVSYQHLFNDAQFERIMTDYYTYLSEWQYGLTTWIYNNNDVDDYKLHFIVAEHIDAFLDQFGIDSEHMLEGLLDTIDMFFQTKEKEELYPELETENNEIEFDEQLGDDLRGLL